jgi:glyoxylase-like metal-dependent hydrolase (beta-lactamase superfamily II)/rhodanese-related sulfurtransferase
MDQSTISVEQLRQMLAQGQPVTVLDVRPAMQRQEWAIPGSLHVDVYDDLKAGKTNALDGLELPHNRPIVTVCGAGKISHLAMEQLQARGLQALSLEGGMQAWSLAWNTALIALPESQAEIIQVRRTGKGCLSYLIAAGGIAAVVDPALPPDIYLELAAARGWTIVSVLESHIHADHLSRGRSLAQRSGATLYLPDQTRVSYPFHPIREGDVLTIGFIRWTVLHTPGHTLESTCYLVNEHALLTGDTLFLNGVGRPDLEATPAEARQRALLLYRSLQRLLALPAETLVLPGHTSAPVAFDGVPLVGSLAEIQARVELLRAPEELFVESILARIPPTPPNHQRIVDLNETGVWPDGNEVELEAGANRCAVA